jgi:Family of unknown function (DUF5302)
MSACAKTINYAAVMAESESAPEDENKRKFREALERKKARTASAADHKDAGLKQPTPHGPAEHRREFRRKSG